MSRVFFLAAALAFGGCITINIYFPAAAAEKAADRIIDEVLGKGTEGGAGRAREVMRSEATVNFRTWLLACAACLLQFAVHVPAALSQPQADLEINTPAVTALRESLRQRHREHLRDYYLGGAIGLTQDGQIAIRDANLVPLAQRQKLAALIAADNQDRLALYREVARANKRPEWESEIRATFAKRWIERIPAGWYYQDPNGVWVRK